jgi:hypothetical protein
MGVKKEGKLRRKRSRMLSAFLLSEAKRSETQRQQNRVAKRAGSVL